MDSRVEQMHTALEGIRASLEVMALSLEGGARPSDAVLVSALLGHAGTLDRITEELDQLGKEAQA